MRRRQRDRCRAGTATDGRTSLLVVVIYEHGRTRDARAVQCGSRVRFGSDLMAMSRPRGRLGRRLVSVRSHDVVQLNAVHVVDAAFAADDTTMEVRDDVLAGNDQPRRKVGGRRVAVVRAVVLVVVVIVEERQVVGVGQRLRLVAVAAAAASTAANAAQTAVMLALGDEDERDDDGERDKRAERTADSQSQRVDRRRAANTRDLAAGVADDVPFRPVRRRRRCVLHSHPHNRPHLEAREN